MHDTYRQVGPTARSVEDETRNDRRNANRNPERWGDFSQLVEIEKLIFVGISRYKFKLRFWLNLNTSVFPSTNSNCDFDFAGFSPTPLRAHWIGTLKENFAIKCRRSRIRSWLVTVEAPCMCNNACAICQNCYCRANSTLLPSSRGSPNNQSNPKATVSTRNVAMHNIACLAKRNRTAQYLYIHVHIHICVYMNMCLCICIPHSWTN